MNNTAAVVSENSPGRAYEMWWSATQVFKGLSQMLLAPNAAGKVPRPGHVPADLEVDFDFYRQQGLSEDVHRVLKSLQARADIFWTPRNGGHWVITRAEDIDTVQRDYEHFSSAHTTIPREMTTFKVLPLEADPPEHAGYRRIINPWFTPKAIESLEDDVRALANELIDGASRGFYAKGECEFVNDFAKRLPIAIFLRLVDLPAEDRELLLELTESATRGKNAFQRLKAFLKMNAYQDKWIRIRRERPGHDLISRVVTARVDDRLLSHEEVHGMLTVILFGGLDTVASLLSFVARFLAENPGHRRQLIDDPTLIPRAVDELIRRFGVTNNARLVSKDHVYKGIQFRKGDLIQVPSTLYGLDERKFANPMEVDFTRPVAIHAAFGAGPHRCPGSYLARTEIKVFIEEWLKRIPDFRIKPGETPRTAPGLVSGMDYLPLVWRTSE